MEKINDYKKVLKIKENINIIASYFFIIFFLIDIKIGKKGFLKFKEQNN